MIYRDLTPKKYFLHLCLMVLSWKHVSVSYLMNNSRRFYSLAAGQQAALYQSRQLSNILKSSVHCRPKSNQWNYPSIFSAKIPVHALSKCPLRLRSFFFYSSGSCARTEDGPSYPVQNWKLSPSSCSRFTTASFECLSGVTFWPV